MDTLDDSYPTLLAASNASKLLHSIHAGREIRVILNAKKADDTATFQIAEAIVKRIEAEMTFPGEIKVIALRETRAEAIVRYSAQMEDNSSPTTPWTITRAEWDGHVRRNTRFMRGVKIAITASPLLLVPLVIVLVLLRNIAGDRFPRWDIPASSHHLSARSASRRISGSRCGRRFAAFVEHEAHC